LPHDVREFGGSLCVQMVTIVEIGIAKSDVSLEVKIVHLGIGIQ
jgi:hypothetical protein